MHRSGKVRIIHCAFHIQEKHEAGELAAGINELLDYVEQTDKKKKARQKELLQMAENDPLTGIKNKKRLKRNAFDGSKSG